MYDLLFSFKAKLSKENLERLSKIKNRDVFLFIKKYVEILNPKTIYVSIGDDSDREYIKRRAIE